MSKKLLFDRARLTLIKEFCGIVNLESRIL